MRHNSFIIFVFIDDARLTGCNCFGGIHPIML